MDTASNKLNLGPIRKVIKKAPAIYEISDAGAIVCAMDLFSRI